MKRKLCYSDATKPSLFLQEGEHSTESHRMGDIPTCTPSQQVEKPLPPSNKNSKKAGEAFLMAFSEESSADSGEDAVIDPATETRKPENVPMEDAPIDPDLYFKLSTIDTAANAISEHLFTLFARPQTPVAKPPSAGNWTKLNAAKRHLEDFVILAEALTKAEDLFEALERTLEPDFAKIKTDAAAKVATFKDTVRNSCTLLLESADLSLHELKARLESLVSATETVLKEIAFLGKGVLIGRFLVLRQVVESLCHELAQITRALQQVISEMKPGDAFTAFALTSFAHSARHERASFPLDDTPCQHCPSCKKPMPCEPSVFYKAWILCATTQQRVCFVCALDGLAHVSEWHSICPLKNEDIAERLVNACVKDFDHFGDNAALKQASQEAFNGYFGLANKN